MLHQECYKSSYAHARGAKFIFRAA